MKAAGLLGLVLAASAALYAYNVQLTRNGSQPQSLPQEQIDVTAIRAALIEIAHAERNYAAAHGTYGTFEQLRANGSSGLGTDRRGYMFALDLTDSRTFTAIATPIDSSRPGLLTLSIDASMHIVER